MAPMLALQPGDHWSSPEAATGYLTAATGNLSVAITDTGHPLGHSGGEGTTAAMARELVEVRLRWNGQQIDKFTSQADYQDPDDLQALLEDGIRRDQRASKRHIAEYEIEVRRKRDGAYRITYVGRSR